MTRLQELRKERGYTQTKMQMLTGIDQSDCSKLENGKRYYTFEQLKRIALAMDTSMDYLAGLTDEKKHYPRKKACPGPAPQKHLSLLKGRQPKSGEKPGTDQMPEGISDSVQRTGPT